MVQVQVKSRSQSDSDGGIPVKAASLDAFYFIVVAFLNIGKFFSGRDGATGAREPEFYTLPCEFVRAHHDARTSWHKVHLRGLEPDIEPYRNEAGFELIAQRLGVPRPTRIPRDSAP